MRGYTDFERYYESLPTELLRIAPKHLSLWIHSGIALLTALAAFIAWDWDAMASWAQS